MTQDSRERATPEKHPEKMLRDYDELFVVGRAHSMSSIIVNGEPLPSNVDGMVGYFPVFAEKEIAERVASEGVLGKAMIARMYKDANGNSVFGGFE